MGKECRRQHGALDVGAGIEDLQILGRAFDPPIGRVILVMAVLGALAIGARELQPAKAAASGRTPRPLTWINVALPLMLSLFFIGFGNLPQNNR